MAAHPTAMAAISGSDFAGRNDIILVLLRNSQQVEAVALGEGGVIGGAKTGTIFVSMSTISPATTQDRRAVRAEEH